MSVHPTVRISPSARINCRDLSIGAGGVIGDNCVIEGNRVTIGRSLWMDAGARIGGGSCHDPMAFLDAGDFLHLGKDSEVNIARGVTLGDEVGIGVGTRLFTHGAYLDETAGFPCSFAPIIVGDRVWLPNAWVNPGVTIGSDVVVAARSLVNRNLPSGCLAGGTPAVVLREKAFPKRLTDEEVHSILDRIVAECVVITGNQYKITRKATSIVVGSEAQATVFDMKTREIAGRTDNATEVVRNQLRRHGIRFRHAAQGGFYVPWSTES